ncbi:MAG: MOSC domain-containing protein [Halioglobus sp.]|nr:MOSC domain-containing protein [Halioglobus sp.]
MRAKQRLFSRYVCDLEPGKLTWIGLRPERKANMRLVSTCLALKGLGLEGDHRCLKSPGSGRQVTLISQEYLQQISHFTNKSVIDPAALRRNLVVEGINLTALRYQQFIIGDAVFEAGAQCHPCSRMEQTLGQGGVVAMLGHGGLCCKVLKSGTITVGDTVKAIMPQEDLF